MTDTFDADDLARLRIALARIARALDRQTRGEELTRTQASALATIARLGPVRISEVAEIEGVNPTMLSRIVAKLEDAGLLRRTQDPDDGRAARVEATAAGAAEAARLRTERTELLARHLAAMPPDEAGRLLLALPALESLAHHLKGTT
ncbi:MarR family winged helix-turn-helix transcriptional regulator [Pseudonocardia lacus]|uniref:MarR family winged helix-turn-helix transcriptional regulator n=1 Tax=Pseudonocardia lacus TaxID=2835865 RepID=UPI001BDCA2B7|nr:MarR family transcriptional regulator [Pseudonocardia lacus]